MSVVLFFSENRTNTVSTTERLLAVLPVGLVPLAWVFTAGVVVGTVSRRALSIGLGVMTVLFLIFALHPAMSGPVLRDWRLVIACGLVANVVSLAALGLSSRVTLVAVGAVAWMLFPVPALVRTGLALGAVRRYVVFAVLSTVGAAVVAASWVTGGVAGVGATDLGVVGVSVVGLGQTGSILDAVARNRTAPLSS